MTTKDGLEFTRRVYASDGGGWQSVPARFFGPPKAEGTRQQRFGAIEFAVFRWNLLLILKNSKDSSSFFKDARKSAKETQRFSKIPKISQSRISIQSGGGCPSGRGRVAIRQPG